MAAVSQGLGTAAAHAEPGLGLCLISSIPLSFFRFLLNEIAAVAECEASSGDLLGFRDEWGNWGVDYETGVCARGYVLPEISSYLGCRIAVTRRLGLVIEILP